MLEHRSFQAFEQITNAVIVSGDNSLGDLSFHRESVMHVEGNATVQALRSASRELLVWQERSFDLIV